MLDSRRIKHRNGMNGFSIPTPKHLHVRAIGSTSVKIGWEIDDAEFRSQKGLMRCGYLVHIGDRQINYPDDNTAIISNLEPQTRHKISVQFQQFTQAGELRSKSVKSDPITVTTNGQGEYDWKSTTKDMFIVPGGMTNIRWIHDDYHNETRFYFDPPSRENIWHGNVIHVFRYLDADPDDDDSHDDSGEEKEYELVYTDPCISARYPVVTRAVKKFEEIILRVFTVCSNNEIRGRMLNIDENSDLKAMLDEADKANNYMAFRMRGEEPYASMEIDVMYIDSYKLLSQGASYRRGLMHYIGKIKNDNWDIMTTSGAVNKNKYGRYNPYSVVLDVDMKDSYSDDVNSSINQLKPIEWNSFMSYEDLMKRIKNDEKFGKYKSAIESNDKMASVVSTNNLNVACFIDDYQLCDSYFYKDQTKQKYSNLKRKLFRSSKHKHQKSMLVIGFKLKAPQLDSFEGGYRSANFKLTREWVINSGLDSFVYLKNLPKIRKVSLKSSIEGQSYAIWDISLRGFVRKKIDIPRRNGKMEVDLSYRCNLPRPFNGRGRLKRVLSRQCIDMFSSFLTSETTKMEVIVTGNSLEDHMIRFIRDHRTRNERAKLKLQLQDLQQIQNKLKHQGEQAKINNYRIAYYDRLKQSTVRLMFTKGDMITSNGGGGDGNLKIITEKMQQTVIDEEYFLRDIKLLPFYLSSLKEPTKNWKKNLIKCASIWINQYTLPDLKNLFEKHGLCINTLLESIQSQLEISSCSSPPYGGNGDLQKKKEDENKEKHKSDQEPDKEKENVNRLLQSENEQLKEKLRRLEQENKELDEAKDELELENSKLTIQLRSVCDYAINGTKPVNWAAIELNKVNINDKDDHGRRTKNIHEYKEILNRLCKERNRNVKWTVEIDQDCYSNISCDDFKEFLQKNGESNSQSSIMIKTSVINNRNKQSNSNCNNENNNSNMNIWKPIDNVLEIGQIKKEKEIPHLEGSNGLFAKIDIPKGTILSPYSGIEFSIQEWEHHFESTSDHWKHQPYLFQAPFRFPVECSLFNKTKLAKFSFIYLFVLFVLLYVAMCCVLLCQKR